MWFYFPKKIELGQQKPIFGFLPPIYQGHKNLMLIWNLTNKKVIQKIYHDRPKGILLASHWPSQPFYPKLKEFSAMPIAISSQKNSLYLLNQILLHHQLHTSLILLAGLVNEKRVAWANMWKILFWTLGQRAQKGSIKHILNNGQSSAKSKTSTWRALQ